MDPFKQFARLVARGNTERRRAVRVSVKTRVLLRTGRGQPFLPFETRDVSLTGLRVRGEHSVPVGQVLDVYLVLPDDLAMECQARVTWLKPDMSNDGGEAGLEFTLISTKDRVRLGRFLDRQLPPTPPPPGPTSPRRLGRP